jgi:hypothetical protein
MIYHVVKRNVSGRIVQDVYRGKNKVRAEQYARMYDCHVEEEAEPRPHRMRESGSS